MPRTIILQSLFSLVARLRTLLQEVYCFLLCRTRMGLLRKSGSVARVATLGNSGNLHKSKMVAADGVGDIISLLFTLQACAIHVFREILT